MEPAFEDYEGDNPVAYVVSLNLRRRHLSESQRAFVAAKLANLREGRPEKTAQNCAVSQDAAADMLNVSRRTVQHASAVRDHGVPDLQHAVEDGRVKVSAAADIATQPPERQVEIVARGERGTVGLSLPDDLPFDDWCALGRQLGHYERSIMWAIGDWWAFGQHAYGERAAVVKAEGWEGPSFKTCANAASVGRQFQTSRRREVLSWSHHAEVAKLPTATADRLLDDAEAKGWSTRELRARVCHFTVRDEPTSLVE